jgi:hypothetical protein
MKNRKKYYATLKEFQKTGNIKPSIDLVLKEYKQLKKNIKNLKKIN